MPLEQVIDTDRYRITDPDCEDYRALVANAASALADQQYCVLPGLILPGALQAMALEAITLRPDAYHNHARRNCYLHQGLDHGLPEAHPRNIQGQSSTRMIAYDQIPVHSPLRAFYQAGEIKKMVADIVGEEALFENEDPFQPANYVCYDEGDESSWHFDADNSFTMTLMIQAADSGGDFELSPCTRSDEHENYEQVAAVLNGSAEPPVRVAREPGALCIFRGCHSLHRVTPVHGDTMRIMGVFVYESAPGIKGDPEVNRTIYGDRTVTD